MKDFWQNFMKGDSDQVHTPYAAMALAFLMATPIVLLSSACVIQHVFVMHKGLDAPTVNLLLGMLGAATGGVISAGATMFSKTMAGASSMFSKTTVVSQVNQPETPPAKPASQGD
jgi:hypothetical protein